MSGRAASAGHETAWAKINLALHVRRRRADGYHDLETVFAFCDAGDEVHAVLGPETRLAIDGPFAAGLAIDDNLVLRAARAIGVTAEIRLTKNLPIASGIGGGSADAAATLRLLAHLSGQPVPPLAIQRALGADVPACVRAQTMRGSGAGEALTVAASVAGTPILLVNPLIPLATGPVFKAWDGIDRGPLADWRHGRNDLEAPAMALVPEIGAILAWLRGQPGVTLARMSGSGATCFALFDGPAARDAAAHAVPATWWHLAACLK